MERNTITVQHGEEASVELTVIFTPPNTDTSHWERTPEHEPLRIHSVENIDGNDLTDIVSSIFKDDILAYRGSVELSRMSDIEALGWKN